MSAEIQAWYQDYLKKQLLLQDEAEQDLEQLLRWLERAILASSLDEVLDEPSPS